MLNGQEDKSWLLVCKPGRVEAIQTSLVTYTILQIAPMMDTKNDLINRYFLFSVRTFLAYLNSLIDGSGK